MVRLGMTGFSQSSLQPGIENRGLEIFSQMKAEVPTAFSPRLITGRLMAWSMRDEALKVRLFRFVDVLASLSNAHEIARHAREYLGDEAGALPAWVRWGVRLAPLFPRLTTMAARRGVAQMAKTFILAKNGAEAVPALRRLRDWPLAFTADILGETVVSEVEADQCAARYLELIENLAAACRDWPVIGQIDCDDRGELPRVNVSIKLSALSSQIHPADPEGAIKAISNRLRPLLFAAKRGGVFINLDMESTALKAVTFRSLQTVVRRARFAGRIEGRHRLAGVPARVCRRFGGFD